MRTLVFPVAAALLLTLAVNACPPARAADDADGPAPKSARAGLTLHLSAGMGWRSAPKRTGVTPDSMLAGGRRFVDGEGRRPGELELGALFYRSQANDVIALELRAMGTTLMDDWNVRPFLGLSGLGSGRAAPTVGFHVVALDAATDRGLSAEWGLAARRGPRRGQAGDETALLAELRLGYDPR